MAAATDSCVQKYPPFIKTVRQFYDLIYTNRKPRCEPRSLTPNQRLELLQVFADLLVDPFPNVARLKERTIHQEQIARHPLSSLCFVCKDLAYIRHHIIQIQHGGVSQRRNIVPLCLYCHAEVHPWLKIGKQHRKTAIDWDAADASPFRVYTIGDNGRQFFYDWLISQKDIQSRHKWIAGLVFEDKNFPKEFRRLHFFINYYKEEPIKMAQIKNAHKTWRSLRIGEIKPFYGMSVTGCKPDPLKDPTAALSILRTSYGVRLVKKRK